MQWYPNFSQLISSHFTLKTELKDTLLSSSTGLEGSAEHFWMELSFLHKHTNTETHSLTDHIIGPHKKYLDFHYTSLAMGANLLESLLHLSCWVILYSQWIGSMTRCFYWLHLNSSTLNLNHR